MPSDHLLRKLYAAEDVEVDVLYGLSAELAAVVDDPESFAETLDLSDLADTSCNFAQNLVAVFGRCDVEDVLEVLLRNYQYGKRVPA